MSEDKRSNWEKYRPYVMNDMTFTLVVMIVMFIIAAIFIL
jgi:competence protein ComGC